MLPANSTAVSSTRLLPPQHLDAIHIWHHQIQHHQRCARCQRCQKLRCVAVKHALQARAANRRRNKVADIGVIVKYQYLFA